MRKILMLALAVALAAGVGAGAARTADEGPVAHFAQKATLGYFRNALVEYLDLGPVKLARGNKTAPIWVFTNGASGQRNVIDTVPGRKDYTPLWEVTMVTWRDGVKTRVLRSAAAIRQAIAAGEAQARKPGVVVNCPVI